jgi:hypothetical protein
MNYTKPEVAILGTATSVIESTHQKQNPVLTDGSLRSINPAYDLDE